MSTINKALEANRNYAENFNPTLRKHPASKSITAILLRLNRFRTRANTVLAL